MSASLTSDESFFDRHNRRVGYWRAACIIAVLLALGLTYWFYTLIGWWCLAPLILIAAVIFILAMMAKPGDSEEEYEEEIWNPANFERS